MATRAIRCITRILISNRRVARGMAIVTTDTRIMRDTDLSMRVTWSAESCRIMAFIAGQRGAKVAAGLTDSLGAVMAGQAGTRGNRGMIEACGRNPGRSAMAILTGVRAGDVARRFARCA